MHALYKMLLDIEDAITGKSTSAGLIWVDLKVFSQWLNPDRSIKIEFKVAL